MADVWACSQCRSLNQGEDRCYKCRSPRSAAGVAPTDLPTVGPSAPVVPVGRYRSSAFRAVIASASILALAIVGVVGTALSTLVLKRVLVDRDTGVAEAAVPLLTEVGIALIILIVTALVTLAAWLSRVVANIPILTGVFPRATPRMTIIQVLIPGYNVKWIPSILRESLRVLDPRRNGDALIAAAIIPLIVAAFGALLLRRVMSVAYLAGGMSLKSAVEIEVLFAQIVAGLLVVGAAMLIAVIARIERRSARLARDGRARAVAGV